MSSEKVTDLDSCISNHPDSHLVIHPKLDRNGWSFCRFFLALIMRLRDYLSGHV